MTLMAAWEGSPLEEWALRWNLPLLEVHDRLASTNDRAAELAAGYGRPLTTVIAVEQTRGRGRSGKVWHSPPGTGLWLSTLLAPASVVPPTLPLEVGLATARALEAAGAGVRIGIKWPNDLFVRGRKVGGILCETVGGGGSPRAVVVGVGVNLRTPEGGFAPDIADHATSLEAEYGNRVGAADVATRLMAELVAWREGVPEHFSDASRKELATRDVLAGSPVRTTRGVGIARGVDRTGALLLELGDGSTTLVTSGTVEPL